MCQFNILKFRIQLKNVDKSEIKLFVNFAGDQTLGSFALDQGF